MSDWPNRLKDLTDVAVTTSGPPASGAWNVDDLTLDAAGVLWVCTAAGSPGTWQSVSSTELGYAQITSNAALTASQADVTGLSITVTAPGGRPVKLIFDAQSVQISLASNFNSIYIMEGATQLALFQYGPGTANSLWPAHREARLTPSAGSHTYKIQANVTGTAGTGDRIVASATSPAFLQAVLL